MRDPAELISAYFDDSLAEGELEQLRAWLAGRPDRMRQFARESVIHSRLRDIMLQHDMRGLVFDETFGEAVQPQHIASLLDEDEAASARRAREAAEQSRREAMAAARRAELLDRSLLRVEEPRTPRTVVYASLAAAAVLLLLIGHWLGPTPDGEPGVGGPVASSPAPAELPLIAEITGAFDAALRRNGEAIGARGRLKAGTLELEQGVAELEFGSGAKMIVEAPAKLELLTAERARLVSGRVVVQVPQHALGFTLHSDAAAFVDLGTEFGVEVDSAGAASMHVLDGEVAFVPEQGPKQSRTLQRGGASEVSVAGAVREIPFDEARFVRRVPTTAYELAVLRSRPLACWRLDGLKAGDTITSAGRLSLPAFVSVGISTVENHVRGAVPSGPPRAAKFDGEHDGVDVAADAALGAVSSCTYEAWVLPNDGPTGPQRIFSTFDRPRSGMAIGVVDGEWYKLADVQLKFQLTVYGFYDCLSVAAIRPGEWVHLAATIDKAGGPKLYVNGVEAPAMFREIAAAAEVALGAVQPETVWTSESPATIGLATAGHPRIGRNPVGSDGAISPERWKGQIANVAVYDRVLDAEEIHEHFLATRDKLVDHSGQAARTGTKP